MFCQHSSTGNGLFVGKLETDIFNNDVVNEFIPHQGEVLENQTIIVIDFSNKKVWKIKDDWIKFNLIRCNGQSSRPSIIVAECNNYASDYLNDYLDIIHYRNTMRRSILNQM